MAKSFVYEGDTLDYLNSGSDISSGDTVEIGGLACIALSDIAAGATGSVKSSGVFDLPKITGAISVGDAIDYDVSAEAYGSGITPAAGDISDCAVCIQAAASGDATVRVKLLPGKGSTT